MAIKTYPMHGDDAKYIAAGFDAYISKPFTKNELLSKIKELIQSTKCLFPSTSISRIIVQMKSKSNFITLVNPLYPNTLEYAKEFTPKFG